MGQSKENRSNKRQKSTSYGNQKSSSDSELAQAKDEEASGDLRKTFLDGLTVDGLSRYRRRRIRNHQKDTLGIAYPSEPLGNNNNEDLDLSTEYRRAFCRYIGLPEGIEWSLIRRKSKSDDNFTKSNINQDDPVTMKNSQSDFIKRPALIRRNTNLKREGEMYMDTETYSSYVAHEGHRRPELARRPTSLRMEGNLDTMTEKCEKFIEWLNVSRPELMRLPSQLKLEGEQEISTESHDKYIPFVGTRRPELLRQNANLRLEGESRFLPEYTDVFKIHSIKEKPSFRNPESQFETLSGIFHRSRSELKLDVEAEPRMKKSVSALEVPEYKSAYKDFPRERPILMKPEDEIGRADGTKMSSSPIQSKFATKIDRDPEYKSIHVDRSVYRKPPLSLRSPGVSSGRISVTALDSGITSPNTTEVKSQYVSYGQVPRVESLKVPNNLRLEGSLDLQPEYKNAYCMKPDYSLLHNNNNTDEPRMFRRRDRSLSSSRKKPNYWNNDLNHVNYKQNYIDDDEGNQDSFQVLDNVLGKPPSGERRASRSTQLQIPLHPETSTMNRSPSPRVYNAQEEPRGFGQRGAAGGICKRSTSIQSSGMIRSHSPDRLIHGANSQRPYSPSFGKSQIESFVVLDEDGPTISRPDNRRRRVEGNHQMDNHLINEQGRKPKNPTNWMPPWYDSSNLI